MIDQVGRKVDFNPEEPKREGRDLTSHPGKHADDLLCF